MIIQTSALAFSVVLALTARAEQPASTAADARLLLPIQRRVAATDHHGEIVEELFQSPLREIAFVTQHLWNVGEPDGPAIPDKFYVGMGSAVNTRREQRINWQYIRPALAAARRAGLCVVHSQPGFIVHKWPQYKALLAERSHTATQPVTETRPIPSYSSEEIAGWTVQNWPGWQFMNFPAILRPRGNEAVTMTSEELDHVLKKRGIRTLVYVGYATDMCLIGYTGGLQDMVKKFGYRAIVLREGTLATEIADGRDGREKTRESLARIEREFAGTACVGDFLNALNRHACVPSTVLDADQPPAPLKRTLLPPGVNNIENLMSGDRATWRLMPNTIQDIANVWSCETNSYGMRDTEFPLAKPIGNIRIVCLGDSVTMGTGVAFDQTYEQELERRLRAQGCDVKVINAGVGSHQAWHGLDRLDRDALRFDPDIVTVCFGLNDGVLQERPRPANANTQPAASTGGSSSRPATPDLADLFPAVTLDEYAANLRKIATSVRERSSAQVYFVTFNPITNTFRSQWSDAARQHQRVIYQAFRQRMIQTAHEMNVPLIDAYVSFPADATDFIFSDGIHPNCKGMRLIAQAMCDRISHDMGR